MNSASPRSTKKKKFKCFYKGNKDLSVKKHTVLSRASAEERNNEDVADYLNLLAAVLEVMDLLHEPL
jgi:hypothetical protein